MQLSKQQTDVLDWASNSKGSLNLIARAGCGKTTTLARSIFMVSRVSYFLFSL